MGMSSWYDGNTLFGIDESNPLDDGSASFRLKNRVDLFAAFFLDVHYEALLTGGEMANVRIPARGRGELQLLLVSRRDPATGKVDGFVKSPISARLELELFRL